MPLREAQEMVQSVARITGVQTAPKMSFVEDDAHSSFQGRNSQMAATIDAFNADMDVDIKQPRQVTQAGNLNADHALVARTWMKRLFPRPEWLNQSRSEKADEHTIRFVFQQRTPQGLWTLNHLALTLDTRDNSLQWFSRRVRLKPSVAPRLSQAQATGTARQWSEARMRQRNVPIQVKLFSEFNAQQKEATREWSQKFTGQDARVDENEDTWLSRRIVWSVTFNTGIVFVDDASSHVIGVDVLPYSNEETVLAAFRSTGAAVGASGSQTPVQDVGSPPEINIRMNHGLLNDLYGLHLPPIIRDSQPLICAEYLPAFLIKHTREGQVIYEVAQSAPLLAAGMNGLEEGTDSMSVSSSEVLEVGGGSMPPSTSCRGR